MMENAHQDYKSFCEGVSTLFNSPKYADCIIQAAADPPQQFHVHFPILQASSPCFLALIETIVNSHEDAGEIPDLPGKLPVAKIEEMPPVILKSFLQLLYGWEHTEALEDYESCLALLMTAHQFNATTALSVVARALAKRVTNSNALEVYELAFNFGIDLLVKLSAEILYKRINSFSANGKRRVRLDDIAEDRMKQFQNRSSAAYSALMLGRHFATKSDPVNGITWSKPPPASAPEGKCFFCCTRRK